VASTPAPDKIDTQAALPEPGGAAPAVAPASDNPASATPATAGLTRNPLMLNGTVTKYAAILTRLDALRSSNVALLAKYTSGSEAVQLNESQIAAMEKEQQTLEQQHPELPSLIRGPAGAASPILDMMAERASLKAAEVRKDNLEASLEALKVRRATLIKDAPIIAQAERNQAINEENLKYLMTSKKKAEVDQKLSTDNIPNIDIIQAATPAKENEALRTQIALGIAGGGPALAMSLVLLFGLLLSPTVKRPAEFEARFGAPVMMSIPWFKEAQRLAGPEVPRLKDGKNGKDSGGPMTPWDADHSIRPYCEVMRDRLGLYFDLNGLHHKPKMIAVAGASAGCGASTLAGGLAAALSKTGDGKVLLVDMNLSQGAAHPFSDGHPATSLDVAVKSPRGLEATADNLYVAKAEADSPGGVSLGLGRLSRLVPELLASKFDYIVFDMPPLSATSPTSALAGVMDHVMVVVEPEKSTHDHLRRSIRDLNDSRAKVSYVFNKARPHGPAALSGI
jgi:Mrp family chromosome partitioning ATPase